MEGRTHGKLKMYKTFLVLTLDILRQSRPKIGVVMGLITDYCILSK